MIIFYTDGSCSANSATRNGGWAFKCSYKGKSVVKYGFKEESTNNEMELMAIYKAMRYAPIGEKYDQEITIFTDSRYCQQALTRWARSWRAYGWTTSTGSKVKNQKLIEAMLKLMDKHLAYRVLNIEWVKGHSGIKGNEEVDKAANKARTELITNWKK